MRIFLFSAAVFLLKVSDASAHHPWDGQTPTLWYQGLVSGLGHPVLGADHLAFLIALSVICAVCLKNRKSLLAFIPSTATGVGIHLFLASRPFEIPFYETAVSASVIAAGVFILRSPSVRPAVLFSSLAGLFHGYAYGSAIVGAETSPLVFYVIGLAAVQAALVIALSFAALKLLSVSSFFRAGFSKTAGLALIACGAALVASSAAF
ncbi:MAG: HupE/UreJ family protein [Thermodesulfobacteriota bacterium]